MNKKIIGSILVTTLLTIFSFYLHASNQARTSNADIIILKNGTQASIAGSSKYFTGKVKVDFLTNGNPPSLVTAAYVTFQPGARTAWHSHPVGQTLIVTSGTGWVKKWGGQKSIIRKGDVVYFPPFVKHWHGATNYSSMIHIAIQEKQNGTTVNWMEHVSNRQYLR